METMIIILCISVFVAITLRAFIGKKKSSKPGHGGGVSEYDADNEYNRNGDQSY